MRSRPVSRASLRSVLFLLGASLVGALSSACATNAHAPLVFEFASPTECTEASGMVPGSVRFYSLRVCPSAGGACIALVDPAADHATTGPDTYVIRHDTSGRFTVDAQVERGTLYDVTAYAYQGDSGAMCRPAAVGRALGVRFGQDTVRIRLHQFDGWTCAGIHEGASVSVPRALHQAVLLPNGEVLLLGGVTSGMATMSITGFDNPIGPQTAVEVFDPRDSRFHAVTMTDEDGQDGLARVFFEARFVEALDDGTYEVRLSGGYDPRAGAGAVGFDAQARTTVQSVLFGPTGMSSTASFRSGARLVYDPATRRATITSSAADGAPCATTGASDGPDFAAVCGVNDVEGAGDPMYRLARSWYEGGSGAAPTTMLAGRIGASITQLGDGDGFLIWGGAVESAVGMTIGVDVMTAQAGEVDGDPIAGHDPLVTPDDGRPWTTAYHAAARIAGAEDSTSILFAGGLVPGGNPSPLASPTITAAGDALTIARFDSAGAFVSGERVPTGSTELADLLATLTPIDDEGSSLLVVGGSIVTDVTTPVGVTTQTLFQVGTVGFVAYDPTSDTYAWSDTAPLRVARWGHTTTMIPGYGVLVVGGLSRGTSTLEVLDSAEMLLTEALPGGPTLPPSASCDDAFDAGTQGADAGRDAGVRDSGARDAMSDVGAIDGAALDTGATDVDAGP